MSEIIIVATKDTYISLDEPDTNYGSNDLLAIEKYTFEEPYRYKRPYLYFPMTDIPEGTIINAAFLYIYIVTPQPYVGNGVRAAIGIWDELALTWNNRPYPPEGGAVCGVISCVSKGWNSTNITAFVNGWLTNEFEGGPFPNHGIQIEPEHPDWSSPAYFYSREKFNYKPYIKVIHGMGEYLGSSQIID